MMALHEVQADRRAAVALDTVATARKAWQREHRRPPALTAREALAALQFEAMLIWTAMANLRNGLELAEGDWDRITVAMRRIDLVCAEART